MSDATITNFIEPTKTVVSWVATRLAGYSSWTVKKYAMVNMDELFMYLEGLRPPFAVIVYTGSKYDGDNNQQRRTGTFSVFVGVKNFTDQVTGADGTYDLIDKAISLLDHEISNQMYCIVRGDKPVMLKNSGIVCYEVSFEFQDH